MSTKAFKILLMDANVQHAELIQSALKFHFKPLRFEHVDMASKGYKKLKHQKYNLVLTDLALPDQQGEQHIQETHKLAPDCPVVVLTANGDEKNVARSIKAGAEDYIIKTRDSLEAMPKIIERIITKFERRHQNPLETLAASGALGPSLIDASARSMLKKLNAIQNNLKKLVKLNGQDPKDAKDSNEPTKDRAGLDQVYEQMMGLKEMVWKFLSGGK
ncbi:MAG: response regulator [Deltaproteobacteria bacterium]|nr:response regulator [Deltaproteobacteria bacterium]